MNPSYIELCKSGELEEKISKLYGILKDCKLCPRECGVDRTLGERGYCRSGEELLVSSIHPHYWEEEPLVGLYGSGTVFLTNCNLGCIYCQNYDISNLGYGSPMSTYDLAMNMIKLQKKRCHNINFVTPTHFVPQLTKSIKIAAEKGLKIPIVYNCGGYESLETIKLLDGIVDLYMPDIKYSDSINAKKYSNAPDYFEVCKRAVKEMHRQVGDLEIYNGIAQRGLLIRHLVLPNGIAGSEEVLRFVASLSKDSYINIMLQYRPMYKAEKYEELNRPIKVREYNKVVDFAKRLGLHRGFEKV
ncbi:MAG TPA: radical SAM protein [Methanosarcinales archaeon]|nr:radical SAM protein [Methanosarcinales archaeon]